MIYFHPLPLTIRVSHLLLALPHQCKILDNGIRQIFEFLQLQLEWLKLRSLRDLEKLFSN